MPDYASVTAPGYPDSRTREVPTQTVSVATIPDHQPGRVILCIGNQSALLTPAQARHLASGLSLAADELPPPQIDA